MRRGGESAGTSGTGAVSSVPALAWARSVASFRRDVLGRGRISRSGASSTSRGTRPRLTAWSMAAVTPPSSVTAPTGAGLVYATALGGRSLDQGQGIAVDSSGSAYVTGYTCGEFPTVNPIEIHWTFTDSRFKQVEQNSSTRIQHTKKASAPRLDCYQPLLEPL